MKGSRRLLAALVLGAGLAASGSSCGGDNDASERATDATTTSTEATTDLETADSELIEDYLRAWSDAGVEGIRGFFDFRAQHAYPPGAWTRDDVACSAKAESESATGIPMSYPEFYDQLDAAGVLYGGLLDESSVEPQPDWVLPPPAPGAGVVPEGRIYGARVTISAHTREGDAGYGSGSQPTASDVHVTIIDGVVYEFPFACEVAPGTAS